MQAAYFHAVCTVPKTCDSWTHHLCFDMRVKSQNYTQDYWVSGLLVSSGMIEDTIACFRPQVKGWEAPTLLRPLERADLSRWKSVKKTETDPVSETVCSLEYRILSNREC
jgi:hypothetical protein